MPSLYVKIVIQNYLNSDSSAWFEGLSLEEKDNGSTFISGEIPDQSALHGLLERIRDLNLQLVSVQVNPFTPQGV
jgi:hypothetical protein